MVVNSQVFPNFVFSSVCNHVDFDVIGSEFALTKHTPVDGDSGQPVFIVIAGTPVLAWAWTTPISGTPVWQANGAVLNALIAVSDANAGVSTGYTVTVATDPTL